MSGFRKLKKKETAAFDNAVDLLNLLFEVGDTSVRVEICHLTKHQVLILWGLEKVDRQITVYPWGSDGKEIVLDLTKEGLRCIANMRKEQGDD